MDYQQTWKAKVFFSQASPSRNQGDITNGSYDYHFTSRLGLPRLKPRVGKSEMILKLISSNVVEPPQINDMTDSRQSSASSTLKGARHKEFFLL